MFNSLVFALYLFREEKLRRYLSLMELNCLPVLFAGRLTLGGVHGEAEGKSK